MIINGNSIQDRILACLIVVLAVPCVYWFTFYLIMLFPANAYFPVLVAYIAVAALLAYVLLRKAGLIRLIGPTIIALTILFASAFVPPKRRQFMGFYDSIQPTMTSEEVQRQFNLHFPDHQTNGWPTMGVTPDSLHFTLDPSGHFNAEFIAVSLTGGTVSDKEYTWD
ncbi:MAG: hypothetical protein CEE38_06510 [Planctomycetes bacterium B3_Pla]|nr:MAG: hypothetical protein CEE38_06510 [Planctomycetes bacterium B3_Pla]